MTVKQRLLWTMTTLALAVGLAACAGDGPNPPTEPQDGLSIVAPVDGQLLSGTVAVAASGIGGQATGVEFRLGELEVPADADGIAFVDSSQVSDGAATLTATGVIDGKTVSDSVTVEVRNDLPSSGAVGTAGGALKSTEGSIATLLPGALNGTAQLSIEDTTEDEIFARFGIDYSALGVTFLGSLTVDGPSGTSANLPVQVELAGWAQGVQPNHEVVMFATAPDADGDGVGELMFAANAMVAPNGSVVTSPIPRSEVHGFGNSEALAAQGFGALQATTSARPGTIVTLVGRGFNSSGRLSNVARFGGQAGEAHEVLAWATVIGDEPFNPTMELRFAVPALGAGPEPVTLHNLTTGFSTTPLDVDIGSLGSGSDAIWTGFMDQVEIAATAITAGRADLSTSADGWLTTVRGVSSAAAAALVANSGLVTTANREALVAIDQDVSESEMELVMLHALVLDAVAASVPEIASAAADLATLLMVATPEPGASATAAKGGNLHPAQSGGGTCSGTASSSASNVTFGNPTGMGSAVPGSCISGSGAGGGPGGGAAGAGGAPALGQAALDPATSSLRAGSFRPLAGALIRVLRPNGERLTAFTAVTDASGYFNIPFIAPGEPFVLEGIDPLTGDIARFEGVAGGTDEPIAAQLLFTPADSGPGAPTASFEITAQPQAPFEGTWSYEFDASASTDGDGSIEEYLWTFDGVAASVGWTPAFLRGYGRNGTYDISLTVVDDEGKISSTAKQLVIDDLPYDYWGSPPERVNVSAEGLLPDAETWYGYAISDDGRYITFSTSASNLGPDDENGLIDLYLKDMETGAVELISSGAAGLEVWSDIGMSADARYIAYTEEQAQTYGTGPNRIVILDRESGSTQEVVNDAGYHRNSVEALSADGRSLLYTGSTLNNSERPAWVRDLDTGEQQRLGLNLDGVSYAQVYPLALSATGRFAVFESIDATLVENDVNGRFDVFITDLETGETRRVSETADGVGGDQDSESWGAVITDDNRYVAFSSASTNFPGGLPGGSHENDQVYLKDLVTGELELISSNAAGQAGDSASIAANVSNDGRYVAFGSYAYNLTPLMDTYEFCVFDCPQGFGYIKDRVTGRVALVTVGLNNATPNDWDQIELLMSGNGEYVAFHSWATNLVEGGAAGQPDFSYDYRARNPLWEE